MDKCRFCKGGIDPKRTVIIEENEYSYVTLANPRLVKGHILVIPKRHVEKISELTEKELTSNMKLVRKYCEKILKFSKGYTIRNNFMPFLGETERKVNHMHIQLIPRSDADEIFKKSIIHENTLFEHLTKEESEDIIEELSKP